MKKIIFLIFICIGQLTFAQDSAKQQVSLFKSAPKAIPTTEDPYEYDADSNIINILDCWNIKQWVLDRDHKSIHQEESEKYAQYNLTSNEQWDSLRTFPQTRFHCFHDRPL
ncbi:MAG TPA: hypothetical protein VGC65_12620 [Bacteroidia bacterium]|jgi:hypothetical protein